MINKRYLLPILLVLAALNFLFAAQAALHARSAVAFGIEAHDLGLALAGLAALFLTVALGLAVAGKRKG